MPTKLNLNAGEYHSPVEKDPLVSIGLPVYNGEETIRDAIDSLLCQTYTNFEIVISDNGSTDNTAKLLADFQRIDPRIRVFESENNKGSIWNFNKVFQESRGKYFMWASHDDHHESGFIDACVRAMENDETAVLCAPDMQMIIKGSDEVVWISEMRSFENKRLLRERYRETLRHFPAVSIYGLHRRSSLAQTDLLPKVIGGDLLLIQGLSILGPFIGVQEVLFTRVGRPKWNSIDQDYMTFFGRAKKPFWYSPFLIVLVYQVRDLLRAKLTYAERCQLIAILLRYQSGQFLLKVFLRISKYLLPNRFKLKVAQYVYWKFMNGPNIRMVNSEAFLNRIIKPKIGWFN